MSDNDAGPVESGAAVAPASEPPAGSAKPGAPVEVPAQAPARAGSRRRWLLWFVSALAVAVVAIVGAPWVHRLLTTVSTDDAYVNGHVTLTAPRVPGQVAKVLVDDNNRVHRGDLLVQLDREPYQVQVDIAQALVTAAEADLVNARATARGLLGQARSMRFALEHAIEDVDNQVALIRSKVATVEARKARLAKAKADYDRAVSVQNTGAIGAEEVDRRKQELLTSTAEVEEALQGVYQVRVALGLPARPADSDDLTQVPADLDQTSSSVRQAQASLLQVVAQLGVADSFSKSPRQMLADFYKRDPQGDIDRIFAKLLVDAPGVKQAEAKLAQAQRNLDEAKLNLRYCDITAEIDGVVTRRSVNPGDNVVAGQSLLAIRSLNEIWVDANFKETQLADLRIGQPADLDVDMYGSGRHFSGRITGFTMGTGSTLALLPPENATGNFVKVVQRIPVRIEIEDYRPDEVPLFIGSSVNVTVDVSRQPTGVNAGRMLQPYGAVPATMPSGLARE